MKPTAGRPTPIRFIVVAATALMAVLLYLDRFCISLAETYIQEDLGLSDQQVGFMLSAFFWSYALFQVPSGWLSDRYGARWILAAYMIGWSIFTGLTGAAASFLVLIVLRLGFGAAQAGAYPTGAGIISKWVPFRSRGGASGIVAVGGRVGGWLAFSLTPLVIVWLVPASGGSQLADGDLLDPARLCFRLNGTGSPEAEKPADAGIGAALMGSAAPADGPAPFPADVQELVRTNSARYQRALEREARRREGASAAELRPNVPPAGERDVAALRAALNRAIAGPPLTTEEQIKGRGVEESLEKEGRDLLRSKRKLSPAETERLNRLLLEAAYPDSIRKVYVRGWREMMFLYGGAGAVVALLFWLVARDAPRRHPWTNEAEVSLIEAGPPRHTGGSEQRAGAPPLLPLVTSRSMWLLCLCTWCTNVGWVFLVTWAPRYFQTVHQLPIETRGLLTSIPPLVGWFGMVLGGVVTDRATRRLGLRWGRALPLALSRFLAAGAYALCLFQPSPLAAVILFSVVAFATDLGGPCIWAFNQDVGGRHVGSVLGWSNMWGNLGAAVAPPLVILIVNSTAGGSLPPWLAWLETTGPNWSLAFAVCGGAFAVAGIASLWVDASIPIAREKEDTAKR